MATTGRLVLGAWLAAGLVGFAVLGTSGHDPGTPAAAQPAAAQGARGVVDPPSSPALTALAEPKAVEPVKPASPLKCTFSRGRWVGNLTWVPEAEPGCRYREFDREAAFECLQGKLVVIYGNSNSRALYSALEGILKNKTITPRLEAKQTCENNQKNHSCGQDIALPGYRNVSLFYWGYVKGVWSPKLPEFFKHQKHASLVVGNSGVNVIQNTKEASWRPAVNNEVPLLNARLQQTFPSTAHLVWMTTTRICEAQPHFRKYTYKKSYWMHRPLAAMNREIADHNALVLQLLAPRFTVLDAAGLAADPSLCPLYDDPLHHKALDKAFANVLLNLHCGS
ncbi:hypothetical protein DIPPA_01309 [Diplonema papillatum]|nr:hypothetical protein DIPPA_01309 [Diplonema papillatum]|eukprot:gene5788-8851_t